MRVLNYVIKYYTFSLNLDSLKAKRHSLTNKDYQTLKDPLEMLTTFYLKFLYLTSNKSEITKQGNRLDDENFLLLPPSPLAVQWEHRRLDEDDSYWLVCVPLADGHVALGVKSQRQVDPRLPRWRRCVLVHGTRLLRHSEYIYNVWVIYVVDVKNYG